MSLIDDVLRECVFINPDAEVQFGSGDEIWGCPSRFGLVTFDLVDTALLCQMADRIRISSGMKPLYPIDGFTEEMCDQEGIYEFNISINTWARNRCAACIEVSLFNCNSEDNGEVYTIDLSEEEQKALFDRLDDQCRDLFSESCDDLLKEAEKRMKDQPLLAADIYHPEDYVSIVGYAHLKGIKLSPSMIMKYETKAAGLSKERGIKIFETRDERFGKVGTYRLDILDEVFEETEVVCEDH